MEVSETEMTLEEYKIKVAEMAIAVEDELIKTEAIMKAPPGANFIDEKLESDAIESEAENSIVDNEVKEEKNECG